MNLKLKKSIILDIYLSYLIKLSQILDCFTRKVFFNYISNVLSNSHCNQKAFRTPSFLHFLNVIFWLKNDTYLKKLPETV